MNTRWTFGDSVRLIRNVRDDGTFPGANRGDLLVRRGRIGTVVDIGTFLMDQVIYSVHFLDENRLVGCREEELIDIDDIWVESRFESRERVRSLRDLAIAGEVKVPAGSIGEVLKVLRDESAGDVAYHVHFECYAGHPLVVREAALAPASIKQEESHV